MKKFNFDDLYSAVINEAPISSYLAKPTSQEYRNKVAASVRAAKQQEQEREQQAQQTPSFINRLGRATAAAAPGVGRGALELAKGVGGVAGEAGKNIGKAALNAPGAIKTLKNFITGNDPAGMVKQGIENLRPKSEPAGAPGEEEFDKDVVKSLLAGQSTDKSGQVSSSGNTSTGTIQAPGTVTGGTATPTSGGTTATVTTGNMTQANLMKRMPKQGDIFTVPGEFGRVKRYKVANVGPKTVSAKLITTGK